jgi:zinc protease
MNEPVESRVRVRHVAGPPLVSVRVSLPGGARLEERHGLALLTGRSLAEGSRRRDWKRIAEEAESLGMAIHASAGWDQTQLSIEALATDWELALEWAAELVLEPNFAADRVRWVARQTAGELTSLAELGDVRTAWAFARQLYGDHPRGRALQGDVASLEGIEPEHCATFHRSSLARGAIVSVAGRIDEAAVESKIRGLLGPVVADPVAEAGDVSPAIGQREPSRCEVDLPTGEQAHVCLGRLTVRRSDPEVPALLLLSTILGSGAGLAGRLPHRLREEEGLAYAVEVVTAAEAGLDPGRFEIYLATSPDNVERAIVASREELARVVGEGIEEDEIEPARSYLLGRLPFARETASQWSALLNDAALYGLPLDRPGWAEARVRSVSRGDVEAAARRFVVAEGLDTTVGRVSG